jgi:hypothetical protein
MNIVLDIKPNFEAQVMGVLQSLNQNFFNSIKVEGDSEFLKNKQYLQDTLTKIDNGSTEMINEGEFWSAIDKNLQI